MDLRSYQEQIEKFDQSPVDKRPLYYVMGMADELAEIVTTMLLYESNPSEENVTKLGSEVGDFLWYFTRYATYQDVIINDLEFSVSYPSSIFINSALHGVLQLHSALGIVLSFQKKLMRGDDMLEFNAVEVLTYVYDMFSILASTLGLSVEDLAEQNYAKLEDRLNRGVIKGSGDAR